MNTQNKPEGTLKTKITIANTSEFVNNVQKVFEPHMQFRENIENALEKTDELYPEGGGIIWLRSIKINKNLPNCTQEMKKDSGFKISCLNEGGMDYNEMWDMATLSKSSKTETKIFNNKVQKRNKGMGIKMTATQTNDLIVISYKNNEAHWMKIYNDENDELSLFGPVNCTDWVSKNFVYRGYDKLNSDEFTEVIHAGKNDWMLRTSEFPYGKRTNVKGWLPALLESRYASFGHKIKVENKQSGKSPRGLLASNRSSNQNRTNYTLQAPLEVYEKLNEKDNKFKMEIVELDNIDIYYISDPIVYEDTNQRVSDYGSKRQFNYTFDAICVDDEFYDIRCKSHKGSVSNSFFSTSTHENFCNLIEIYNNQECFSIIVKLKEGFPCDMPANRQYISYLDPNNGSTSELKLEHFRTDILDHMPLWFKELTKQDDHGDTEKDKLEEHMKKFLNNPMFKDLNFKEEMPTGPEKGNDDKNEDDEIDPNIFENEPLKCPSCAKKGWDTELPKGTKECIICGYVRPESKPRKKSTGKTFNISGKKLDELISHMPDIKVIEEAPQTATFIPRSGDFEKDTIILNSNEKMFGGEMLKEQKEKPFYDKILTERNLEIKKIYGEHYYTTLGTVKSRNSEDFGLGMHNTVLSITANGNGPQLLKTLDRKIKLFSHEEV